MPKTVRRSPLSVSTKSSDYPTRQAFNQIEFKGIQTGSNELITDQSSFADAENVYLDRDYNLASRPPLKDGTEAYMFRKWMLGDHSITIHRSYTKSMSLVSISSMYDLTDAEFDDLYYMFLIQYKNIKTGKYSYRRRYYKVTEVGRAQLKM